MISICLLLVGLLSCFNIMTHMGFKPAAISNKTKTCRRQTVLPHYYSAFLWILDYINQRSVSYSEGRNSNSYDTQLPIMTVGSVGIARTGPRLPKRSPPNATLTKSLLKNSPPSAPPLSRGLGMSIYAHMPCMCLGIACVCRSMFVETAAHLLLE